MYVVAVDPDCACFQRSRHRMRNADVPIIKAHGQRVELESGNALGPNSRSEPVGGCVGSSGHLFVRHYA